MKKILIFILYVFVVAIIFSGCNISPLIKDHYDLGDTVTIKVNEKLYESKDLWVRLDSITRDNRCPEGWQCFVAGGVEAKFTIGYFDSTVTLYLSTDSVLANIAFFGFTQAPGGSNFILNLISARPVRQADIDIPQGNYEIDFVLESGMIAYKPNIYLYPKITSKMDVFLCLPQGGCITESDPQYPCEWNNIKVKPSGKINNEYDYLFYEAALPDRWQYEEGWSVMINDLETFFRKNLTEYGFIDNEINDFINYWIPKLDDSPYYNIYPQYTDKVDELVTLHISKEPKSLMRMFYVIKESPLMKATDIPAPMIPEFERNGFTVTEWGVVLK
jgi:hypothetical protein